MSRSIAVVSGIVRLAGITPMGEIAATHSRSITLGCLVVTRDTPNGGAFTGWCKLERSWCRFTITADVYSHVFPSMLEGAMDKWDSFFADSEDVN